MTDCLRRFWPRTPTPTVTTTVGPDDQSPDSTSETKTSSRFRPPSTELSERATLCHDSASVGETDFDQAYDLEKHHWSNLYNTNKNFHKLIDQYVKARAQVHALKASSSLTVKQLDELHEKLGTSLAIAVGLARRTGWTDETSAHARRAGNTYGQASILSNALTQLPGIGRGVVNLVIDALSMYDPDNQCAYQIAKAAVDAVYVAAQSYLAVMVPLWNAGWQPLNVAGQAHEGPPWQPAINSSKCTGEDGKAAPIVAAKEVKQQWQLLQKVIALTLPEKLDEATRAKIQTLSSSLDGHLHVVQEDAKAVDPALTKSKAQEAEFVRLVNLGIFLGDMKACLSNALEGRGRPDPSVLEKHRKLLIDDRLMGMMYGQLNVMRSAGHVRAARNVLNGLGTAVSMMQSIRTGFGVAHQGGTGASTVPSSADGYNSTMPEPMNLPCNPSDTIGFEPTTVAVDSAILGLNLAQVAAYSIFYGRACGEDYLGKLATQFKIIAASGLGNFTDEAGAMAPARIDAAMKGPVSLRVEGMKKVLEQQRSLATMAFLANKIRIDAKQEQGDGTGPTELLKEFKRCNTPESRTELLTQWGLGEDTDAKANLAEYEDMDALLHSLGKGELEEMLISKKLPDTFRRIFLGSLRHAVGSKDGNDAHVDKELSDLVGKAKKFDDLESVLQSAQKYGQQFAAVVAGSGSPQALKALGMLIGMAMMASGKFDSAALTRNAAKLRSVISTVSLAGSIIGVGLGYGYHKPIALKNDQRARNEGRTTHPNNGVLNQGRFDYLGTINWSRLFGRLTDFKALSGKKLQASKARIAVDGPSLWDATKEQIWATGMNSKSFASKWFKFFGVQPGQLIDADQMTRWLGTIKAADEAPRETVDAESQPADEAAETVIPMPPGSEDEPAFLTRRSWKSNRYAKPPVSATTHVAVPSVIASQPDGIPAARPEDTRVRTERHEPNNAWSGIGPGQVPQLRCSSEQLFDAEGNLVGYGYRLVPDTSNEEPMGDLGLSHHILAVTPPVKGCFYREYQQGNYCGLHVLNMINMAVTQDFGLLMSPAQAAGRLAKANSLGETSEFSAATLVELNATNKDKVPQLTHLQCTEQHIAVAISGDQASDNVERTFAESHLAGITFRHKMAGDVETRGHTVLLVKGANGVFTIVDPKSVGLETMTSQARNMREAAFTYFRAHALCDTEENKTFDVFFPSEGEAPALSDTSSEESTVRLEKTSSEQSGSEASTEDANTSGETSSSD